MSLRFPGAVHREEDLTLARINSQRHTRTNVPETPSSVSSQSRQRQANIGSAMDSPTSSPPSALRRRVVLPDPVAFRYVCCFHTSRLFLNPRLHSFLEEDPFVAVIERKRVLSGYELYLVEQWACSRQSPALVIVTYTGDPKHSIVVGVLDVPKEENGWSQRLRIYFKAIQQYHARPKDTDIGELMVTNLSSFPSALTCIPVPDGDIKRHRQVFIVNENLKRLGCSGRSGLTLSEPTPATQARFLQQYKTSDRVSFRQAVIELIKLCQVALFIFGKLEPEYIDGLLCDLTEIAINNWWTEIGSEYFNIEPSDGILGPTTVAALLGTLMGARNRLSYSGAPVSKDVFDIESTKRGIGTFQKAHKLERTRRLDRQTLLKLHSVTAKAAAGEGGWGVQKAVKSTVAEIGGKRGELVIGMVGGRDKGNIGDIETLDLHKFINLAYGERPKWLWHGKARRTVLEHEDSLAPFGKDLKEDIGSQAVSRRTNSAPVEDELEAKKKEDSPGVYVGPVLVSAPAVPEGGLGDRDALRKTVFKSVAGKVSDARSGLGRIRDAVGVSRRGHISRPSKDEGSEAAMSAYTSPSISTLAQSSAAVTSPVAVGRAFTWKNKPEEYLTAFREGESTVTPTQPDEEDHVETVMNDLKPRQREQARTERQDMYNDSYNIAVNRGTVSTDVSATGSVIDEADPSARFLAMERNGNGLIPFIHRRHSISGLEGMVIHQPNEARFARRLSFSDAEDAVLTWTEIINLTDSRRVSDPASLEALRIQAEVARNVYDRLLAMQTELSPWVTGKLANLISLDDSFGAQQAELQTLYVTVSEAYQRIHHDSGELVAEERSRLTEAVKDVEVLVAKLEYEINALVGRVLDIEDGVAHFEAQVEDVEKRADELKAVLETESWPHWFVRTLTGIGTGPNITRGSSRRGR